MPDFGRFTHVWLEPLGGMLPLKCQWCGSQAKFILTRQTDDNTYINNVCDKHASEWSGFQEGVQLEMEIDG